MSKDAEPTPYDLEPTIDKPDLPGDVIVRESIDETLGALSLDLLLHAHNCVRTFGDFHFCLSGEASVEPALLRLLTDPATRDLPWRRTHLWLFSERLAEPIEYDLIHETIAIHADLPGEQIHAIDTAHEDIAARYERELRETLAWREKGHDRLDYALLTPGSVPVDWAGDDDDEEDALVRTFTERIACTRRLINATRLIAVLAADAPARAEIEQATQRDHPLAALKPIGGALRWYLDAGTPPHSAGA